MDDEKRPDKIIAPDGTEIEIVYDAEPDFMTLCFREAVDKAIADSFARGFPVARWDGEKKAPYFEYPDGTKDYSRHIDRDELPHKD